MKRDGFVLVTVLTMAFLIVAVLVLTSTFAVSTRQTVSAEAQKIPAFYVANAGLERALARIAKNISDSGTTYVNMPTADVAAAITAALGTMNGSLSTGSFVVTPTHASASSTVSLKSVGTTAGGATRTILLDYRVDASKLTVAANAAVTTTGDAKNNGNAAVMGEMGLPIASKAFQFTCTATGNECQASGSPRKYAVTVKPGFTLPEVGDAIKYNVSTTDSKYPILYRVSSVDAATRKVVLTAVNEDIKVTQTNKGGQTKEVIQATALSKTAELAPTLETNSVVTYSGGTVTNGNNAEPSCNYYSCEQLSGDPSKLFEATFGVTKTQFYSDLPDANKIAASGSDFCPTSTTTNVQWWTTPSSGKINLVDCTSRNRVLIVDARAQTNKVIVSLTNGGFKGLLYVISNNQEVTVEGNNGGFAGSVIVETGTTTTNPTFTFGGTAKENVCPPPPPGSGLSTPKICYVKSIIDELLGSVRNQLDDSARPKANDVHGSWTEAGS